MPDWMTDLQNEGTDFLNRVAMDTPNRYNTPSNIPTYATHDAGQGDITRLPEGRTSSSVRQSGGANQTTGGGGGCSISPRCALLALGMGALFAIAIIVAGML